MTDRLVVWFETYGQVEIAVDTEGNVFGLHSLA